MGWAHSLSLSLSLSLKPLFCSRYVMDPLAIAKSPLVPSGGGDGTVLLSSAPAPAPPTENNRVAMGTHFKPPEIQVTEN